MSKTIAAIAICAAGGSFRRAGRRFGKEPEHFAMDYFNEDQARAIHDATELNVSVVEVDPSKVTVIGLDQVEASETEPGAGEETPADDDAGNDGSDDGNETMLIGSSVLPAEIEIAEGAVIQLGKLVGFAQEQSGFDVEGWNAQPEDEREGALAASLALLRAVAGSAKDGKAPSVNAVAKAMDGEKVSADQRDAAWELLEGLKEPEGET